MENCYFRPLHENHKGENSSERNPIPSVLSKEAPKLLTGKRQRKKKVEMRIRIKMSRDMSISSRVVVGVIPSEGHRNKKEGRSKVMLLQMNRYQICCRESTSTIGTFS